MSRKSIRMLSVAGVMATALMAGIPGEGSAQGVYAYPTEGQSQQQQERDKSECHVWAVDASRFDPYRQQTYVVQGSSSPPPSSNSGLFGRGSYGEGGGVADAGKGAAVGAIGGAIAGNAGKGAAIGALSGLFIGGVKRSNQEAEREQWERRQAEQRYQQQQQIASQQAAGEREYRRAYSACMQGRGYQVQ